tara:strand:+ start:126 stop:1106 length:981 start_codon:yes stop_codon:yes gene_type:complete
MRICFLDGINISYNSDDIYSSKIRGAENILINLSREFSKLNHEVTVLNNCDKEVEINNIKWRNINKLLSNEHFDIAITNNDIRLLNLIKANKKIAISHSIQTIEKFIRKRQLHAYLKNKPKIVILSEYHKLNRNFLLRLYGYIKVNWGVDAIFINENVEKNQEMNNAIFTSHIDRNLDLLISIWKKNIFPFNKDKKLLITPIERKLDEYNIFNRTFGNKQNLISDLSKSRMLLIPGHKAELFCIAAEEARELCVPIVTLGLGCLGERVNHGETGFIAKNENEFSYYANLLFNDEQIWLKMRENLIKLRGTKKWENIALDFLGQINE